MNYFLTTAFAKISKTQTIKVLLFIFFTGFFCLPYESVLAQSGSIADVCGQGSDVKNACKVGQIGPMVKSLLGYVLSIGLPFLLIFVSLRVAKAWFALREGNASAYKETMKDAGNAVLGFIFIVVLIGGGLYTILTFFGVNPQILKILNLFSSYDSGFFPHAYAAQELPNFIPSVTNLYDFVLNALRLFMKFAVYPALIVVWVWTGFLFVMAQGAPEAIVKAKKLLVAALISTLVIVMLQGFLTALRASALKIMGKSASGEQVTQPGVGTADNGQAGGTGAGGGRGFVNPEVVSVGGTSPTVVTCDETGAIHMIPQRIPVGTTTAVKMVAKS